MHNFSDLEYWAKRWDECYPATYPPELYSTRVEIKEHGWWIFKKDYIVEHAVCARCGERIMTGHQCRDIYNYIMEKINERSRNSN